MIHFFRGAITGLLLICVITIILLIEKTENSQKILSNRQICTQSGGAFVEGLSSDTCVWLK